MAETTEPHRHHFRQVNEPQPTAAELGIRTCVDSETHGRIPQFFRALHCAARQLGEWKSRAVHCGRASYFVT